MDSLVQLAQEEAAVVAVQVRDQDQVQVEPAERVLDLVAALVELGAPEEDCRQGK
jgi:hypothetical protein